MTDQRINKQVVYEPEPSSQIPRVSATQIIPIDGGHYVLSFSKILREDETTVYQEQIAAVAVFNLEDLEEMRDRMSAVIVAEKDRLELPRQN